MRVFAKTAGLQRNANGAHAFSPMSFSPNRFFTNAGRRRLQRNEEKRRVCACVSDGNGADYCVMMSQFEADARKRIQKLLDFVGDMAAQHACTTAQVSLAWMMCKKPFIVPIPGTRKKERLFANLGAAGVILTADEVAAADYALEAVDMSEVYGGTTVKAG